MSHCKKCLQFISTDRCRNCVSKPVKKSKPINVVWKTKKRRIAQFGSEKDLFLEVWNERKHECVKCSKKLHEPKSHNFSHIKSKGSRPDLRYNKDNIEILCFACHFLHDHGLRYKWPDLDI